MSTIYLNFFRNAIGNNLNKLLFITRTYIHFSHSSAQLSAHGVWIDNFSKTIRRAVPTEANGVYTPALWTGVAVFVGNTRDLDDRIRRAPNGDVIPAMPDNLLSQIDVVKTGIHHVMSTTPMQYDSSIAAKYDVRSIPLKIDTKRFPDMANIVDGDHVTLKSVLPSHMIEENIGSNRGLIAIIRKFYVDRGMDTNACDRYLTICADENIFWRVLKVLPRFCCSYMYVYHIQLSYCHR